MGLLNLRLHIYVFVLLIGFLMADLIFDIDILLGNKAEEIIARNHAYFKTTMVHFIPVTVIPLLLAVAFIYFGIHIYKKRSARAIGCLLLFLAGLGVYSVVEQAVEKELPFLETGSPRVTELVVTAAYCHLGLTILLLVGVYLLHSDLESHTKIKKD
ncbi:hypothetical protein HDV06_001854 [Boothiomyces sp. JEL0866]|nr:hypothetical protein HDV06_001854 [Boothiomyces sp. JEL0866]